MNNSMKFNQIKSNNSMEYGIYSKTPKGNNIISPKSNYDNYMVNDVNAIYSRFSSLPMNNSQTIKEIRNKSNTLSKLRNDLNEENKNSTVRSMSKGPFENKKSITLYDSSALYNSENFSNNNFNSYDPKTTRYTHKPFDNKYSIKESPYSLIDSNDNSNNKKSTRDNTLNMNEERKLYKKDNLTDKNNNINPNAAKMKKDNSTSNQILSNNQKNFNFVSNEKNKDSINVMKLLNDQNFTPISIKNFNLNFHSYNNSRYSTKSMPIVKAYSANTYQGIVRNYNEDRVSIILNIVKPASYMGGLWPKCSFFGIYDGHGGASCADFLRDKLHQYIIKDSNFPNDVGLAIKNAFEAADKDFLFNVAMNRNGDVVDRSGSCAIVALLVNNTIYTANVGDSRAVISADRGRKVIQLSDDQKPNEYNERKRIIDAGGSVYQTQTPARNFDVYLNSTNPNQVLLGPYRVFPGRLSVSRAFGNVEAKFIKFGGNPSVLIAIPEIKTFEISKSVDFMVIGCDGIFDQLSNEDLVKCVWMMAEEGEKSKSIHEVCGTAIDMIIKSALSRKSLDNVTCAIVAFENFERIFNFPDYANNTYKEKNRPSIQPNLEYINSSSSSKLSKNGMDGSNRPITGSISNKYSSQTPGNKNDVINPYSDVSNDQDKLPRKPSPSMFNNRQKKIFLDLTPQNKKEDDYMLKIHENRKINQSTQSFLEKNRIPQFSINEINSHYPLTTKNIDPKLKSYNNPTDPKKVISFRNYGY